MSLKTHLDGGGINPLVNCQAIDKIIKNFLKAKKKIFKTVT